MNSIAHRLFILRTGVVVRHRCGYINYAHRLHWYPYISDKMPHAMGQAGFSIQQVDIWPVDIPLVDPFVIATGSRTVAENVFVRVTLMNGIQGYGEAAPFPETGGETRASCLPALTQLGRTILGYSTDQFKNLSGTMKEQAHGQPAARCALETAVLDAHCRALNVPMSTFWGGEDLRDR